MMDAVSRCGLDLPRAREAFSSSSQPSANGHDTSPPEQPLADRYYELAETMNARGAMELAVPFYRQAVALLLEERQQLRQLLPDGVPQPPVTRAAPALSDAAVEGLLAESSPSTAETLEARLAELAEELTPTSAQQVLVGVDALLRWSGASVLPSSMAISSKPVVHSLTRAAIRAGSQAAPLRIGRTTLIGDEGKAPVRWSVISLK